MTTDMTKGRPAGILVRFTLPMLLSVAFQQLYNISDSVIAGKFAGEDALAAVSYTHLHLETEPLSSMLTRMPRPYSGNGPD